MKEKIKHFLSFKFIQIKQLWRHKARTLMLLFSLTFSFTLMLTCVFTTVNFGRYTYWTIKSETETVVYRSDNTILKDGDGKPPFIYEDFVKIMEENRNNSLVKDSIFYYQPTNYVESEYQEENLKITMYLLEEEEMHLTRSTAAKTKSLKVRNFIYGGFPASEDEIALHEETTKMLGIDSKSIVKGNEPIIKVSDKEYRLTGVINANGLIDYPGIMHKSSYKGEMMLSHVTFSTKSNGSLNKFKGILENQGVILDIETGNELLTSTMLIIISVLVVLTFSITIISMLMYFSNFKSLIKECEKQTCLNYYLGYTKNQTTRDMLFKLCFIGTIAFICASILSTIIGLVINTQKTMVFGGMPLHSIALPDVLGVFIGYVLAMSFIILLFTKSIKKTVLKLPNNFGGNV